MAGVVELGDIGGEGRIIERAPVLAPVAAAECWRRRGECWRCVRRCGLRSGVPRRPAPAAQSRFEPRCGWPRRLAQGLNGCEASGSPVTGSRPSSSLWMGSLARCSASLPSGWCRKRCRRSLERTIGLRSVGRERDGHGPSAFPNPLTTNENPFTDTGHWLIWVAVHDLHDAFERNIPDGRDGAGRVHDPGGTGA